MPRSGGPDRCKACTRHEQHGQRHWQCDSLVLHLHMCVLLCCDLQTAMPAVQCWQSCEKAPGQRRVPWTGRPPPVRGHLPQLAPRRLRADLAARGAARPACCWMPYVRRFVVSFGCEQDRKAWHKASLQNGWEIAVHRNVRLNHPGIQLSVKRRRRQRCMHVPACNWSPASAQCTCYQQGTHCLAAWLRICVALAVIERSLS